MMFSSAPEFRETGGFVRLEEHTMRTSLNTLVAADTSICIFENHMLVPQETDFPDNMFRTLLHTLPTSHASTWIHDYILSCYSFHLYLLFACKVMWLKRKRR